MKKKLYEVIQDDLLQKINLGIYKADDRLPSEAEIMKQFSVSRVTVRKALSELKKNKVIYSNTKNGTFVSARNLKEKKAHLLIPLVGTLPQEKNRNTLILDGIKKVADNNKCVCPFYNTDNKQEKERKILVNLLNYNLDAIIIWPCSGMNNIDILSIFVIKKIPVVFLDRRPQGFNNILVTTNNFKAMKDLLGKIIDEGYTKIATTILPEQSLPEQNRFNGYITALLENNIPLKGEYLLGNSDLFRQYYKKTSKQRLDFLIDYNDYIIDKYLKLTDKPEVICCANDNDALNLMYRFKSRFGEIPKDLIVTGFDNLDFDILSGSPTIEQDSFALGKVAIEVALQLINNIRISNLIEIDAKPILRYPAQS